MTPTNDKPVALITGASAGLGQALTQDLAVRGWHVIVDARHGEPLLATVASLDPAGTATALVGDISDAEHRRELAEVVSARGRLDLLVNNASTLGPTPLRALAELEASELQQIFDVNVFGPEHLIWLTLKQLRANNGVVVNISSDAAVASYANWGGYGAAKAALDHLTLTHAAEEPDVRWYAVDPGDLRTAMQQAAFPGEDISDRPLPASVVPAVLSLITARPASGRYRLADLVSQ
jgi:NAD(P)-dependent dehydrogenase (short-subunit alcohol dehydrogenase family)